MNVEDKKLFIWNKSKQKKCYAKHPWWKEMSNGNITSEAWKNTYKKPHGWRKEGRNGDGWPMYWLNWRNMQYLHWVTLTRHWSYISETCLENGVSRPTFTSKENTSEDYKIKKSQMDNKKVIVSFGNWGNLCDSIAQRVQRKPVQ